MEGLHPEHAYYGVQNCTCMVCNVFEFKRRAGHIKADTFIIYSASVETTLLIVRVRTRILHSLALGSRLRGRVFRISTQTKFQNTSPAALTRFRREVMGSVFGKIDVEVPKHTVISTGENYEIREYPECLAAEVTYDPSTMKRGRDGGFMLLAGYIGAVGKPNNMKASDQDKAAATGEKIAMTAPVITQESQWEPEKIAMTAPVITQEAQVGETEEKKKLVTMQFLLPVQYNTDNVPKPTDDRISVKVVPVRKYGVLIFSGVADESLTQKMLGTLRKALEENGYKTIGEHLLARYNPPWTLGHFRKNEVLLPVE